MTLTNWDFDCRPFQPRAFPTIKYKHLGITGRSEFAAFSSVPKVLETRSFQPLSSEMKRKKYLGIKGKSEFAIFATITITGMITDSAGVTVSYSVTATRS